MSTINLVQKRQWAHISISLRGKARGRQRLSPWKYYSTQKWENRFILRLGAAKNTHFIQKCFELKLLRIKLRTKKSVGAYVDLPRSGIKGFERLPSLKYYNVQKWESEFTLGSTLPKIRIISKHASTKSCGELNSVQKSKYAYMFIFLWSGAGGLQRLICFKYYIVPKWKSRFCLGLNTAKNTDYMRKRFK